MVLRNKITFIMSMVMLLVLSCNSGPKTNASPEYRPIKKNTGILSEESDNQIPIKNNESLSNEVHTVKVNEVLKTSKYLYLSVTEKDEQFWIATRLMDINVGETYYYKGGLLKINFESKEHQRVFEKIYLVSTKLVPANHATNSGPNAENNLANKQEEVNSEPASEVKLQRKIEQKGSIKISELVKNYKEYAGKTVQISGVCTKVNANIMGKNWIHIRDGSKDDYDLVITSNTFVKEGDVITIKAVVSLDKDFGAGYTYELILEEGIMIP